MAFFKRLMDHMLNQVIVDTLAHSRWFQRFVVHTHKLSKDVTAKSKLISTQVPMPIKKDTQQSLAPPPPPPSLADYNTAVTAPSARGAHRRVRLSLYACTRIFLAIHAEPALQSSPACPSPLLAAGWGGRHRSVRVYMHCPSIFHQYVHDWLVIKPCSSLPS
jgi:hypothetical protein